jgi:hypothetical protein
MSSITQTSLHFVTHIEVESVLNVNGIRWQAIVVTMKDGSTHTIACFLEPGYDGLQPQLLPSDKVGVDNGTAAVS